MRRSDDDDLETVRPCLVASPGPGRDAHHVPYLQLDDLLVELHSPASADDHVHLLLLLVRVAVREAITGRDPLVAQTGLFKLERLGRQAELQVGRAVEPGPEILHMLFEVPERERHRRQSYGAAVLETRETLDLLRKAGQCSVALSPWPMFPTWRYKASTLFPAGSSSKPRSSQERRRDTPAHHWSSAVACPRR